MATHSSILDWEIPWTEEPGGLWSMGLQRVGHNLTPPPQDPWPLRGTLGSSLRSPAEGEGHEGRSEERRVGKECRSRWSPYH